MNRDYGIDILKCMAVLCIYNAHSSILYPVWPWLSTGGYLGDALFFFCSGFTLLMKGDDLPRFDTWYKRRLGRIWPSCFAWAAISAVVFGREVTVIRALQGALGWFVPAILLFYILIYIVGKYGGRWLGGLLVLVEVGCLCGTFADLIFELGGWWWNKFYFFPIMLLGAWTGRHRNDRSDRMGYAMAGFFLSAAIFTGLIALGTRCADRQPMLRYAQAAAQPFLLAFVYLAYRVASSARIKGLSGRPYLWNPILWIGGLCLDFYLVKWLCITGRLTFMFPLNLPVVLAYLLVIAYFNRAVGRFIAQTFCPGPYDWRAIWKL